MYQSTWKSCTEVQFIMSVKAAAEAKVKRWKEPLTCGCFSQGTETIHMKHISLGSVSQLFRPKAWGGKTEKYKGLVSAPILLISNFHWVENCQKGLVCEQGKWDRLLFPYDREELQSCQPRPELATFYFSAHTPLTFHCPLHPQSSGFLIRYFHQEVTFIKLSPRVLPLHYGHFCVMLLQE